jgi:hypothetical protein
MLNRLVLLIIALALVPASARAIVVRPAVTGSVGNAVVEWETTSWGIPFAGGPALGGEILVGTTPRLLFGVAYNYWDFKIDSHGDDEATQSDLDVCVRIGDVTSSRVNFFVTIRAGYSYQVRRTEYPVSPTTFEWFEFSAHGFGVGFVGGPSIGIGRAELEITAGFRFSNFGNLEPVDSDRDEIPGKSGAQVQLRLAIALPFGN